MCQLLLCRPHHGNKNLTKQQLVMQAGRSDSCVLYASVLSLLLPRTVLHAGYAKLYPAYWRVEQLQSGPDHCMMIFEMVWCPGSCRPNSLCSEVLLLVLHAVLPAAGYTLI